MKKLSPREEEIMSYFWTKGPMFVRELIPLFEDPKPHFNTVSTIVRMLEEEGYLSHESLGNSYRYYTLVSAEEYAKRSLKQVISRYFNNSYLSTISTLVREEKISLEELKDLIREVENNQKTF